jgi:hypothetical protein
MWVVKKMKKNYQVSDWTYACFYAVLPVNTRYLTMAQERVCVWCQKSDAGLLANTLLPPVPLEIPLVKGWGVGWVWSTI